MRFGFGLFLSATGLLAWLGSMMIDPYNTLGVGPEYIRPGIPTSISDAASLAALLFLAAGFFIYSKPENRRSWQGIAFAVFLLFFAGTAVARIVWIQFSVIGSAEVCRLSARFRCSQLI